MGRIYTEQQVGARVNAIEVRDLIGSDFLHKVHKASYYETFFDPTIRKRAWVGITMSIV